MSSAPDSYEFSIRGEQLQRSTSPALLVFVVSLRRALADRFVVFVGNPAVESGLQSVSLRGHQAGRPEQGFRAGLSDVGTEECFANTSEDDRSARFASLGSGNGRNLKIHEGIMSNIGDYICRASRGDRNIG